LIWGAFLWDPDKDDATRSVEAWLDSRSDNQSMALPEFVKFVAAFPWLVFCSGCLGVALQVADADQPENAGDQEHKSHHNK
jgi:hypothetical protein